MIRHSYFTSSSFDFMTDYLCSWCKSTFATEKETIEHEEKCKMKKHVRSSRSKHSLPIQKFAPDSQLSLEISLETKIVESPAPKTHDKKLPKQIVSVHDSPMTVDEFADNLEKASRNASIHLSKKECKETAWVVMSYFGFSNTFLSNHLSSDEIALMYDMEDLGLVKGTLTTESLSATGREWRISEFHLIRHPKIADTPEIITSVYDDLPEIAWHKEKEIEEKEKI